LSTWWPPQLRGTLSIIEHDGESEFRTPALPAALESYDANMMARVMPMLAIGGFGPVERRVRQGLAIG